MEAKNTAIEKIVISKELSERLVAQGLPRAAVFHYERGEIKQGIRHSEEEGDALPAWTFEELRIMIGNKFPAPDLPEPRPKPIDGEDISFFLYTLTKSIKFTCAAEAAGTMLAMLLEEKLVKPEEAAARYKERFKPQ